MCVLSFLRFLTSNIDDEQRTRYLNAVNTFKELLSMGVVPIVNENDTVSVSVCIFSLELFRAAWLTLGQEIKFGDNDTLSAITASMIQADYLFLLTDVDGLYTSNPRKDPNARIVETVDNVTNIRHQGKIFSNIPRTGFISDCTIVSTATAGSSLGTGGMETKLIAAEIGTAAGVTTIISSSKRPENVCSIIDYHNYHRRGSVSGRSTPTSESDCEETSAGSRQNPRPPHTCFKASLNPLRDLKSWTSHTLHPSGSVIIDAGAYRVLSKRTSGGRLLPAGVVGVIGRFSAGQAVRIVVRKVKGTESEEESQRTAYERARPSRPATPTSTSRESSPTHDRQNHEDGGETVRDGSESGDDDGAEKWYEEEVVEVGRGLANYNHSQIAKIKGLNRCVIMFLYLFERMLLMMRLAAHKCPASSATRTRTTLWRMLRLLYRQIPHTSLPQLEKQKYRVYSVH